jgi:hypothetical protein
MLRNCLLLIAVFATMSLNNVSAQDADEQAIVELIQERYKLVNIAKSTPRIAELLKLHTNDFTTISTIYLPDGSSSRRETDIDGFKRVLSNYSDAGTDVEYRTTVENVAFSQVYDKSAVAIYRVSYFLKDLTDGSELFSGNQIVTADFKNTPDGWKFRDMYITEFRSQINKYPCAYELYQKDADEMLVSVKLPAGNAFKNEYIDVRFNETKPGLNIIYTDRGDEFSWENNVLRITKSDNSAEIIGRPNNKTAVCDELILYYHGNVCSGVRMIK